MYDSVKIHPHSPRHFIFGYTDKALVRFRLSVDHATRKGFIFLIFVGIGFHCQYEADPCKTSLFIAVLALVFHFALRLGDDGYELTAIQIFVNKFFKTLDF